MLAINRFSRGRTLVKVGTATVDHTTGTIIGDFDTRTSAAFDGTTSQADSACAEKTGSPTSAYIGKDWGSGISRYISAYTIYGSNNVGYVAGANPTFTLNLRGSNSLPSSASDGTLLDTQSVTDITGAISKTQTGSIDATAGYRYHWFEATGGFGGGGQFAVAEIALTEDVYG